MISQTAKQINVGDKVEFDWNLLEQMMLHQHAYLLNVDTGDTIELINFTQASNTTDWANTTNITTQGNYKFVFINGTYDATGEKR